MPNTVDINKIQAYKFLLKRLSDSKRSFDAQLKTLKHRIDKAETDEDKRRFFDDIVLAADEYKKNIEFIKNEASSIQ